MSTNEGYIALQAAPPSQDTTPKALWSASALSGPWSYELHKDCSEGCFCCEFQTVDFQNQVLYNDFIKLPVNRELLSQVPMTLSEVPPPGGQCSPVARTGCPTSARNCAIFRALVGFYAGAVVDEPVQLALAQATLPRRTDFCQQDIFKKDSLIYIKYLIQKFIFFTLARPPQQLEAVLAHRPTRAPRISQQRCYSCCNIWQMILKSWNPNGGILPGYSGIRPISHPLRGTENQLSIWGIYGQINEQQAGMQSELILCSIPILADHKSNHPQFETDQFVALTYIPPTQPHSISPSPKLEWALPSLRSSSGLPSPYPCIWMTNVFVVYFSYTIHIVNNIYSLQD